MTGSEGKRYVGERTIDGIRVTADGAPLAMRLDLERLSPAGFEWTYEGDGPAQLALALLADHLGDDQRARALYRPFMRTVIANLDNDWEMTGADIDAVLATLDQSS